MQIINPTWLKMIYRGLFLGRWDKRGNNTFLYLSLSHFYLIFISHRLLTFTKYTHSALDSSSDICKLSYQIVFVTGKNVR